ncbi:MAG: zinc ribbon domain-containing protein [Spirochaetales bacterium]|uniref:Zinc ribbon domain-containing protein n=1 Tax=Candidatus Thalassospirochaeta sargassi TaxID=3119039 RepID=A0AAJ1MJH3_9SPIO|nr:zinc ribbon domain-containing protein [Spirochaetales bacterium]
MPTYEYECVECGHRFEAFQAMSEDPLTECEHCKGPVKRLIFGGTGIIFKGSGFYVNDSSKAGKQSTQAAKSEPKDSVSEKKSDSGVSQASKSDKKEKAAAK